MDELKARQAGNGDVPKPLSSHIVEVVRSPIWDTAPERPLEELIEEAYSNLSERAAKENSLILGVVQAVSTYTVQTHGYVLVVLTAQRISREDFERQQRMAQMTGGPRR